MDEKMSIWYLEMMNRKDFIPKYKEDPELEIVEAKIRDYRYNRFLYSLVGEQWSWTDKLNWNDDAWREYAEDEDLITCVAYYSGTPAGYFELKKEATGDIKIEYFGLSPRFIGKGIGSHLLTIAIATAWELNPKRVWVHTCSLDHPAALQNYKSRGFKIYDTKIELIKSTN